MKNPIQKFYEFLDRPIQPVGRVLLALAVIPLLVGVLMPLWRIHMTAPQYPGGLWVDIYSYQLVAGNRGQHLQEINTLNHYIGMHAIERASLKDLDWLPFALGALALLTLRLAAIGNVRMMLDHAVLSGYVLLFAFARFVYTLYHFGHDLDPTAPVRIAPFTPVIFGTRDIANFTVTSLPRTGAYAVGVFALTLLGVLAWHLVRGRREAERAEKAAAPATTPAPTA